MADVLFEEVQQFKQKWVEGLLLLVNTFLILIYVVEVLFSDHPNQDAGLTLITAIIACGGITFLIKRLKLVTQITTDGIQVRFSPLQRRFQLYRWSDIDQIFIRTYNPLLEYGGWGLRIGPSGSAYNATGNVGLQLVLHGNHRILIGTEKADLLLDVLHSLGRA